MRNERLFHCRYAAHCRGYTGGGKQTNDYTPRKASMSIRAAVAMRFIALPPAPKMIAFCVGLSTSTSTCMRSFAVGRSTNSLTRTCMVTARQSKPDWKQTGSSQVLVRDFQTERTAEHGHRDAAHVPSLPIGVNTRDRPAGLRGSAKSDQPCLTYTADDMAAAPS